MTARRLAWGLRCLLVAACATLAACDRCGPPPAATGPPRATFRNLIEYSPPEQFASGLRHLHGLALDKAGQVLAAAADGITVFSPDGRRLRCWPTPAPARAVAVAADGRLFVALRDRVEVYDASGKRVGGWDERGRGQGKFGILTAIAVREANVFVADAGSRRILRFDATGDFINEIGRRDAAGDKSGFHLPSPSLDFAVNAAGELLVGHTGRLRVERYSANGDLLDWWGRPGLEPDAFCGCCNPIHVALTPEERVVTVEKGLPRIKVHEPDGRLLAVLGGELTPQDLTAVDQTPLPAGAAGVEQSRLVFGSVVVSHQGVILVASPRDGVIYSIAPRTRAGGDEAGGKRGSP